MKYKLLKRTEPEKWAKFLCNKRLVLFIVLTLHHTMHPVPSRICPAQKHFNRSWCLSALCLQCHRPTLEAALPVSCWQMLPLQPVLIFMWCGNHGRATEHDSHMARSAEAISCPALPCPSGQTTIIFNCLREKEGLADSQQWDSLLGPGSTLAVGKRSMLVPHYTGVQTQDRHQKYHLFTWFRDFSLVMPGGILLFYSLHFLLRCNTCDGPKVHCRGYDPIKL